MKKQEIIKLLIDHYIYCIWNLPIFGWKSYLAVKRIQNGVCWCANYQFDEVIEGEKWVCRNTAKYDNYWFPVPLFAKNYFQCIWRLYARVRILKKELKIVE